MRVKRKRNCCQSSYTYKRQSTICAERILRIIMTFSSDAIANTQYPTYPQYNRMMTEMLIRGNFLSNPFVQLRLIFLFCRLV